MKKEMIDTLNELSKKPITELAMSYMEVVADNMIKDKEIARLNKIIERLVNYNELVYKRYNRKIKDHTIRSIVNHNLEIIKELKGRKENG